MFLSYEFNMNDVFLVPVFAIGSDQTGTVCLTLETM